jgi:hypothetical protein
MSLLQENYSAVVPQDRRNNLCKPTNMAPYFQPVTAGLVGWPRVVKAVQDTGVNMVLVNTSNTLMGLLFYLSFGSEIIGT